MLLPRRVVDTDVTCCAPDCDDCIELLYADMLVRCVYIERHLILHVARNVSMSIKLHTNTHKYTNTRTCTLHTYLSHYFRTVDCSNNIFCNCFQLLSSAIGQYFNYLLLSWTSREKIKWKKIDYSKFSGTLIVWHKFSLRRKKLSLNIWPMYE